LILRLLVLLLIPLGRLLVLGLLIPLLRGRLLVLGLLIPLLRGRLLVLRLLVTLLRGRLVLRRVLGRRRLIFLLRRLGFRLREASFDGLPAVWAKSQAVVHLGSAIFT